VRRFLDTNILIYAQQSDAKGRRAREILAEGGEISVQVLNEFTHVLHRKFRRTWPEIEAALEDIARVLPAPRPLTRDTHASAMAICRQIGCSFYDAHILASALEANCEELLSEDLQDGRRLGKLTIRNPFI